MQLRDQFARGENRVGRAVRLRGVAAAAANHDVESVGGRHDRPGTRLRTADGQIRPVMQRVHRIAGEALEQAVLDHRPCTAAAFLGGLEDEVHGAVEAAGARKLACGTEQDCRVPVVSTAVMDAGDRARMGVRALLDERQRIHVGAQSHGRAAAPVAQHADHAGSANALVHLEPDVAQRARDERGRAVLLEGEFRMGMQVASQRDEIGQQVGHFGDGWRRLKRSDVPLDETVRFGLLDRFHRIHERVNAEPAA